VLLGQSNRTPHGASLISPAVISYFFADCQFACFFVNLVISYIITNLHSL
jgi:hypothetical protein